MSRVFPSPRPFVVLLVLLAGTVLGALLCWIVSLLLFAWQWGRDTSRGLGLVTPEQAIAVFHAHRADCARLRELVVPVLPGGNHATAANLPAGRFERCTELLARLGAYAVASCRAYRAARQVRQGVDGAGGAGDGGLVSLRRSGIGLSDSSPTHRGRTLNAILTQ